jgi:hypothetical protein
MLKEHMVLENLQNNHVCLTPDSSTCINETSQRWWLSIKNIKFTVVIIVGKIIGKKLPFV